MEAGMARSRWILLALMAALLASLAAVPSASAQELSPTYPLGPLVPPEFANPPESVPRGPVGEYPEDWARCVRDNPPGPQQYPRELDTRAVDPSTPNPL